MYHVTLGTIRQSAQQFDTLYRMPEQHFWHTLISVYNPVLEGQNLSFFVETTLELVLTKKKKTLIMKCLKMMWLQFDKVGCAECD
jgi:hypothetical protein